MNGQECLLQTLCGAVYRKRGRTTMRTDSGHSLLWRQFRRRLDSGQCIALTEGIHLTVRAWNQMGEVVWYRGIYVSTHRGVAPTESK